MKMLKKGEKLTIHCYKHDGKLHRTWNEATVLEETDDILICGNNKTLVTESDGRSYNTQEPAIIYFYKRHWFNIIAQFKKRGIFYYCNIATPYLIDNGIIKYIDYDIDLRVFPDGSYRVLDLNEYHYHSELMHYPPEIDGILKQELTNLINLKKMHIGPFDKEILRKYQELYQKIHKN